jgi:hypothetical protein
MRPRPTAPQRSTRWLEAEVMVRAAARRLEYLGVVDSEAGRTAKVLFRLASRIRSDRLEPAA